MPAGISGPFDDGADVEKSFEGHRPLQDKPVISQPVAVIGRVDDIGVVGQTLSLQLDEDPADRMVDQRDLAIGIGDDLAQMLVRDLGHP